MVRRSTPRWPGRPVGARWVHLVDLDAAAFGRGSNRELIAEVVGRLDVAVELSGGIRDDGSLDAALATRIRAGRTSARRHWNGPTGCVLRSPGTASGSRLGSTSAAQPCCPRLDR